MSHDALAPKYVRKFQCTGSKCPDNCCHSWNVGVDPETLRGYRTNPALIAVMQDKLIDNYDLKTKESSPAYIKLNPQTGKCSLQEENGLCSLQKRFGEDALCATCDNYPRHYKMLGNDITVTLTESCPEVAKLLIDDPEAMELSFAPLELSKKPHASIIEEQENYADRYQLLQALLTLLRHRNISLEMRLFIAGLLVQRAQTLLEGDDNETSMQDLCNLYFELTNQGYFQQQARELQKTNDGALGLVILNVLVQEKPNQHAFKEELKKALDGLQITGKRPAGEEQLNKLKEAWKKHLKPFYKKQSYALENLVVNWLIRDMFPIQRQNIQDGWASIFVRYLLLRTLSSGIALQQKSFEKQDLIRLTYRFGRGVTHSSLMDKLMLELAGKDLKSNVAFARALHLN
ncbi:flagellin lysine-N-methylase [Marinospirillum perlucidum]|uniref:flagellin lysine-N-methylase n=1 Tax=Marinospirillum perlucidum TaxID=1982602 RepID=UPI001390571B|nr:flagellin lysine-N-methylase [Marinospirillum perlucidum]